MPDDGDTTAGVQDLPCRETYVAVFENMDTVVFFNAKGYEAKIWEKLANATLPSRNIEGEEANSTCPLLSQHEEYNIVVGFAV